MDQTADLVKIEQNAFRTTYQDGLYDLCYGIFLLAWAVVPIIRDAGVPIILAGLPFLAVPAIILLVGKKYITTPRLGTARFSQTRLAKATRMLGFGAVTLVGTYILIVIMSATGLRLSGYQVTGDMTVPLVSGAVIFLVVSGLAYFSDFPRLYIYAVLFGGGIPLAEILYSRVGTPADELIAFGIPALGIIVTGLLLLRNFLKNNPLPDPGVANDL